MSGPFLTRREISRGTAAGVLLPGMSMRPQAGGHPQATPAMPEGPSYPAIMPEDENFDLLRRSGQQRQAEGQVTYLRGQVLDLNGEPVIGARVEIWQCDARGIYHELDAPEAGDPAFTGCGAVYTGLDGDYAFRTIRPVSSAGHAPQIHFKVIANGHETLNTQLFDADALESNLADSEWAMLKREQRAALTRRFRSANQLEDDALVVHFNIWLG